MTQQNPIDRIVFSNGTKDDALPVVDSADMSGGVLFIGCPGFRFSVRDQLEVPRETFFLHQTLANSVKSSSEWKATFEYAVGMNGVETIVVCGHEDCLVIQDSLKVTEREGTNGSEKELVDLRERFRDELLDLDDNKSRADKLSRLNVRYQVHHLTELIERGEFSDYGLDLEVHGWYWSREESQFVDLKVSRQLKV